MVHSMIGFLLLFATSIWIKPVESFVPSSLNQQSGGCNQYRTILIRPQSALNAKKKAKGKSGSAKVSQGFGAATTTTTKKDDDFKNFPRLDPEVMQTIIPSTPVLFHEAGGLPDQVYDHLSQVYGFDNFNHRKNEQLDEGKSTESNPTLSLEDLLVSPKPDLSSPLGSESSSQNSDLKDLISLATGGDSNAINSSANDPPVSPQNLQTVLSGLPPFTKFRVLHFDPLVLSIDDFFTEEECDKYIDMSSGGSSDKILQSRSPTVGKDKKSMSQRTSTTWYHFYSGVPELMAKSTKLLGLDNIGRWEEPQTVRYRRTEKFTWHLDALGPNENRPNKGGQRVATLLVYLSDLSADEGGSTLFRDLKAPEGERLAVTPKKGSALLFFPAAGGIPNTPFDIRTLHSGEAVAKEAEHDKWIAQLWLW